MRLLLSILLLHLLCFHSMAAPLPAVRISPDGTGFLTGEPPQPFRPWGLNYGNAGRLIEDFWNTEWKTVTDDFAEMKALGANVVRVHLQFGKFMLNASEANPGSLTKLRYLLVLAESTGLYLDLTGLACYRTEDVPKWYDTLTEAERWAAQSVFWEAVARTCAGHTAVFCYDLINEPLSPAGKREPGTWYSGKEFGGYDFLQMISLDQGGRTRTEVVRQWLHQLTAAIRKHDTRTPITVGMLPTVAGWGHMSGFIPAELASDLDFISGHLYPESGKPNDIVERTTTFSVGKPLVIEETFALFCQPEEFAQYLTRSAQWAAGWMMHYDGETLEELEAQKTTDKWTIAKSLWAGSLALFKAGPPAPAKPEPDFLLRDGDTCVFLGDSITAARGYTKIVELYTLMRFPNRQVRFYPAGKGGDTASGCLERLDRDVFRRGATVVTVAFGVNDIGWGMKADDEHRQRYLDGIREIVTRCRARGVRPVICSPAITAEDPDKAENGFLQKMTDDGMALARSLGAHTIDLQRGMREVQRRILDANKRETDPKKITKLHVDDGVHLTDLGQLAMAYAMIKGLGAPPDVSSATIDWNSASVSSTSSCTLTDIQKSADGLSFTRLDEASPLNLGILSGLNYRWIPIPDGINRCLLTVTNLPAGEYTITAGGRPLGKASAQRLAAGLNISSMTADGWQPGGPWDAQSISVKELVDARDSLLQGTSLRHTFDASHPDTASLDRTARELDDSLTNLMRRTATPQPCRFEIRKAQK